MKRCLLTIFFAIISVSLSAYGNVGPVSVAAGKSAVYIACKDSSQILAYNLNDHKISLLMDVSQKPCEIVVSADGNKLFVSAGVADGKVFVIDTAAKKITQMF